MPLKIQTNDCLRDVEGSDVGFRGAIAPEAYKSQSRVARQSSRICLYVFCVVVSFQGFRASARVSVEVEQVRTFQVFRFAGIMFDKAFGGSGLDVGIQKHAPLSVM